MSSRCALFAKLLPITIRLKREQRFRHMHYELRMILAASLEWAGEVALQISVPPRGVEWKRKTAKTDINNER